jgi:hypothetical protein
MEKKAKNLDLSQYWQQRPEAKVLYQVDKMFFFELHYAENYSKLIGEAVVTHVKKEQLKKDEEASE